MDRARAAVIVERRSLVREALAHVVGRAQLEVVASVPTLGDFDRKIVSNGPFLVMIGLATEADLALQDIKRHREQHRSDRIVVLSDSENRDDLALSFIREGVDAYLDELTTPELLLKALDLVLMGGSVVPASVMDRLVGEMNGSMTQVSRGTGMTTRDIKEGSRLSTREMAVLGCLVDGSPNKVIARKVEMAEATVKVHVKAILRKIGVKNRTEAAIWAITSGGLALPSNRQAIRLEASQVQ